MYGNLKKAFLVFIWFFDIWIGNTFLSVNRNVSSKKISAKRALTQLPETFCSNATSLSYAVCSTILSVIKVNQNNRPPWTSWHNYPFLQAVTILLKKSGRMVLQRLLETWGIVCVGVHIMFVVGECTLLRGQIGEVQFWKVIHWEKGACVFARKIAAQSSTFVVEFFFCFKWNLNIAEQLYKISTFSANDSI